MFRRLVRGSFSAVEMGARAPSARSRCCCTALVATPLPRAAELAIDLGGPRHGRSQHLPAVERFQARDGTALASATMPPSGPATGRAAIVVHGSSGRAAAPSMRCRRRWRRAASKPSRSISAATARPARAATSAMSASSRTTSPISSALIRKTAPTAPLTLVGHSSGGGFALRVAGSPIQNLFERTVLLAPYLGYDAPTSRPNSGGWAKADIPRIVGLVALRTHRHHLLRGAAGAGVRGAAEFREEPDSEPIPTG